MIFLDTNAFYYASQISINNDIDSKKLRAFIKSNEMAISSVSFYEFLVKNRDSLDTIHKGSEFLADNNFKIAYNKYFKHHKELDRDYTCINETELKRILEIVIADKIDTESRFAAIVYDLILFSGFYFYFLKKGEQEEDIKKYIFETCYRMWTLNSLEVFQQIFKEGYESKNCEKHVKNAVRNLLEFSLGITFPIFDAADDFKSEGEFHELINDFDFMGSAEKQLRKMEKYDSSIVYLSKLAKKYNESAENQNLTEYINSLMQPIEGKIKESGLKEYLRDIADSSCRNGSPFMKNDILDAIILCNIEEEYELITFDNKMINHMKKYSKKRETYSNSLLTIGLFKCI